MRKDFQGSISFHHNQRGCFAKCILQILGTLIDHADLIARATHLNKPTSTKTSTLQSDEIKLQTWGFPAITVCATQQLGSHRQPSTHQRSESLAQQVGSIKNSVVSSASSDLYDIKYLFVKGNHIFWRTTCINMWWHDHIDIATNYSNGHVVWLLVLATMASPTLRLVSVRIMRKPAAKRCRSLVHLPGPSLNGHVTFLRRRPGAGRPQSAGPCAPLLGHQRLTSLVDSKLRGYN